MRYDLDISYRGMLYESEILVGLANSGVSS
jgi:hypothetical protein